MCEHEGMWKLNEKILLPTIIHHPSSVIRQPSTINSQLTNPLINNRRTLTNADTHGGKSVMGVASSHFMK